MLGIPVDDALEITDRISLISPKIVARYQQGRTPTRQQSMQLLEIFIDEVNLFRDRAHELGYAATYPGVWVDPDRLPDLP